MKKTTSIKIISAAAVLTLFACVFAQAKQITVKVTNPLNQSRASETVSVELKLLPPFAKMPPVVYSYDIRKFIPCQVIDNDGDGTNDELIFQSDFNAAQMRLFEVADVNQAGQVVPEYPVAASFVPQRKDDFAWENDKIAFRMYGQELQRTELISSGIDVWVKKVKYPVMIDLYAKGHDYFHSDNPWAVDFFNVGETLCCGGLGTWFHGKLYRSQNYYSYKIIAAGPIRTIFELTYKPWQLGKKIVGETKRFTLDLGSNLNCIQSRFDSDVNDVSIAVGIVKCKTGGHKVFAKDKTTLTYWQNPDPKFGIIGCAVILPKNAARNKSVDEKNNYLLLAKPNGHRSITYYAGACWNKSADFTSEKQWTDFITQKARQLESPLKVEVLSK
jgi:hypothetical protein